MGLSKNTGDGFQTIILKLISKENGQNIPATLKALKKQGEDGKYEEFDRFTKINGKISKIELKTESFQSNGVPMDIDKVKIIFRDDELRERYVLDLNYTNVTRSLFNSLLSIKDFSNVEFSFYQNKQGYNSVYVTENGNSVSWAYTLEQVPKVKKVIVNKKKQSDFGDVDDFFKDKLLEFVQANSETLTEQTESDVDMSSSNNTETTDSESTEQTTTQETTVEEPQMESVGDVDDLPF